MTKAEALHLLQKYSPCRHDNSDTSIGDGRTWAKCEDCNLTFKQENWHRARVASEAFDEAICVLSNE